MTGLDRLHEIADDVGRTVWLRDLGAALSDTADAIEGGTSDPSGYESDVLAWVEKNGGLDAIKARMMPEGMEWPRFEDGEPVRLGEHWQQDEYDWSITSIDSIEFAEDGVRFENEYADAFYRYGERVKRPAPPVLDADGVEISVGDTVWSTTGEFDGKRTVSSVHIDPDEPPYAMFEERQKPYSCLCCYLTHRAPVIAADGEPLEVGQTVWVAENGNRFHVVRVCDDGLVQGTLNGYLMNYLKPDQLTHQRPVLDADGVPIHEGDTVYLLPGEWCGKYPLCGYSAGYEMVVKELYPDHGVEGVLKCAGDGKCDCFPLPCQLTHTKPEPTDSLERIADEIDRLREDVALHLGDYLYDEDGNDSIQFSMELVAKRCRALAERERGE